VRSGVPGEWYNTHIMKRELGSLATHRAYLKKPPKQGSVVPFPCRPAVVYATQVNGLAKRLKAIGCKDVVLGLSGGLDSTLALLVCVGAFGKLKLDVKGIHVCTMPGFGTTKRTKGNAELLCEGLGLGVETISIAKSVRRHLKDIGHDGKTPDVTYENAQARMRTLILMDKANMTNGIVIGTGDLSEIALGWCTYNGDHMSMFGVNSGVPKTVVRKVCAWWAEEKVGGRGSETGGREKAAKAVLDIIATPVSPELVKGQVTEDRIGPYELHDFFLWNFIMNEMGSGDLQKAAERYFLKGRRSEVKGQTADCQFRRSTFSLQPSTFSRELIAKTLKTFMWRFFTQAFKRNCAPDGVRVFPFDLSPRGWWIPSDLGFIKV